MRNKKELYEIILNEYRLSCEDTIFICNIIKKCFFSDLLTRDEFYEITNDFNMNRPTDSLHSEFMNESYNRDSGCWWSSYVNHEYPFKYNTDIRLTFLEKMVRIQDAIL